MLEGTEETMQTLFAIGRSSWIVMLAAAGLMVGAGMIGYSMLSGPPARASLQTVDGVVTEASRTTRKSRRTGVTSSYYELTLKPANGSADLKLRILRSRWRSQTSGR